MKSIYGLFLALFPAATLVAEPHDFAALLKGAREQSESLGLAKSAIAGLRAQRRVALGEWLPQVTLKATENFADMGNTSFESPGLRVNAREDLFKGLDQPAALKIASAALAQAQADLAQAELDLEEEVGGAYFDVLSLEEELAAERLLLEAAKGAVKELQGRVSLGRNRRAELSSAEAQAARVQAAMADLEGQAVQAREALASLCRIGTADALAPLSGVAEVSAGGVPQQKDIEGLPSVLSAREAMELSRAQKLAVKGGFFPNLFVEGNYHVARQGGAAGPAWDAQVGVDLPIFQGGAQMARLNAAEAQLQSARLRLDKALREALREARQAQAGLTQARAKAEASRLALEAAEKSYADQQKDFRNSLVTTLDLLNAFQAVENARLEALRARYATHRAELRYRLALGRAAP